MSRWLGTIYWIRYDIYRKKFFIKFLNTFLGQLTPFFFYSIGGYLVINGQLTLGALVAVLSAYKDMSDPWEGTSVVVPAEGRHPGQVRPVGRAVPSWRDA